MGARGVWALCRFVVCVGWGAVRVRACVWGVKALLDRSGRAVSLCVERRGM